MIVNHLISKKDYTLLSKSDRRVILSTLEGRQRKGSLIKKITYNNVKDAYNAYRTGLRPKYKIDFLEI